ncbi:endopeptidase La [Cardiobacterium valvarum]|uniref:Lon protease n=1 Tax=Cardiobacterium valvarum F0432 TaxID=797473 RepID=G9ZF19_9GAMM|nr:endopeptidase La [Cardiobacterium valvarum]EHM54218.1 endopeptidase La [Cardiobacterium valvarum F0432]
MQENNFPVLPLRDVVVYPHVIVPLFVGREKSIAALEAANKENQEQLLLVPQKDATVREPEIADLHPIGTVGRIVQMAKLSDGTVKVLVEGLRRVEIEQWQDNSSYLQASYRDYGQLEADNVATDEQRAMAKTAVEQFARFLKENDKNADDLLQNLRQLNNPGRIADTIAAHMDLTLERRIAILDSVILSERLQHILIILEEELEKTDLDRKIRKRVKQQMERNQREYYLNEQIKAIQKELGEMEDVLNDVEQLEKSIKDAGMSADAEKKALSELNKLKQMSPMSAEANVIRNYLEWMIDYPWSKRRRSQYDIARAEKILDRDHYGLKDVKERILDYLAVQKRNRNGKGPIICLVGPPGVGKTSLGKSIAEATGRDFDRISLGGVHDEAEIRGHRRTYIGSLPGKIVQKLCKLGSNNPLILLDEIDKMGMDHRGDPASALLEVLDPAQNSVFSDHYLETDVDLSSVLFIATANTLNIPVPLLDRMEVIRLPGYTSREKNEIATRYILPRQIREHGLHKNEFQLEDGVINDIIEDYTREAGVRNLEREIGKLARKSVRKLLTPEIKSITIDRANLEDYLGVAKYRRSEDDLRNKIGCVTGLAWTSVGGETLQIEATVFRGKGKLNLTGQLGDVMKESIQAASSVIRSYLETHLPDLRYDEYDIHMHLPEGATPKDGPSAGIGMATALLSALCKIPVRGDLAMTGEITLHGRVLAIGGLKEKLLAAVRSHITTVLIPEENRKDLRDIPDEVKDALIIIPVNHIEQVFEHAFEASEIPLSQRLGTHKQPPPISTEAVKNVRC